MTDNLITLDSRRRVSLSKFGRPEHYLYAAAVADDGTITLTPAIIVPATERPINAR